jgi:adenylate cyclase
MVAREADVPEDRRIRYRIGVNLGDIVIDGDDILGDGVNLAARLEGLAAPGGVCISDVVHQSVAGKIDLAFEDLGEQQVKNIKRPVRAYGVHIDDAAVGMVSAGASAAATLALPDKPSIAVLAFNNMSGDPEQEFFADGIAEDIITGLSRMKDLLVIARNSSFTYKDQSVEVRRVGQELGVRYVLEGSVRRGGDKVRVTAQLIDTLTGGHVWAERYDGTLDDIFALQDDITAKVLSAVGPEITLAEIQRARSERSESVDAWDRYLRALPPFYAMDKAGYEEATALLREAIEIDPKFATAYATLARCYVHAGFHGWGTSAREVISKAEDFARKATALDEQEPLGHLALGWVHVFNTEPDRAINELKRALELNPNLAIAWGYLSEAYGFAGRPEEALAAAERAQRGSPRDPERHVWFIGIMNAHFAAARYEEAAEAAEQAVLLQPNLYGGYAGLAYCLPYLGRIEEAKEAVRNLHRVMPRMTLKSTARNPMFVRENDVARMLEALRLAGLPE